PVEVLRDRIATTPQRDLPRRPSRRSSHGAEHPVSTGALAPPTSVSPAPYSIVRSPARLAWMLAAPGYANSTPPPRPAGAPPAAPYSSRPAAAAPAAQT